MIPIKYVIGDATEPHGQGRLIVAHICNDVGAWGSGFVLALSQQDNRPEQAYRRWYKRRAELPRELSSEPAFALGEIQFAPFHLNDVFVCNMIAQHGTGGEQPLYYNALRHCLRKLAPKAHEAQATVHMPRIGCGLGGGTWEKVQPIIMQELCASNVEVMVYDLPQDTSAQDVIDRAEDELQAYVMGNYESKACRMVNGQVVCP